MSTSGNLSISGSLTLNNTSNVNSYNFPVTRGTSGQFLQSDGNGGTTWATPQMSGASNGGILELTGSGNWIVPQGIKKFNIVLVGGGGGGQAINYGCLSGCRQNGASGSAGGFVFVSIPCQPGDTIQYSIGNGGNFGLGCSSNPNGGNGGDSYININGNRAVTAFGGVGGGVSSNGVGGNIILGTGIISQGNSSKIEPKLIYVNSEVVGRGGNGACCGCCCGFTISAGSSRYGAIIF